MSESFPVTVRAAWLSGFDAQSAFGSSRSTFRRPVDHAPVADLLVKVHARPSGETAGASTKPANEFERSAKGVAGRRVSREVDRPVLRTDGERRSVNDQGGVAMMMATPR
jgi:hypothetical protein